MFSPPATELTQTLNQMAFAERKHKEWNCASRSSLKDSYL